MATSATLVRGQSYTLLMNGVSKTFLHDQPVIVTDDERSALEERALDSVTVEGTQEFRPKFKFAVARERRTNAESV